MCVCGEGEVLVFMYKGVFVVDGVTVGGKVVLVGLSVVIGLGGRPESCVVSLELLVVEA